MPPPPPSPPPPLSGGAGSTHRRGRYYTRAGGDTRPQGDSNVHRSATALNPPGGCNVVVDGDQRGKTVMLVVSEGAVHHRLLHMRLRSCRLVGVSASSRTAKTTGRT